MESDLLDIDFGPVVHARAPKGAPQILVLCEHASNRVPEGLTALGLSQEDMQSHIAWDPGAMAVADHLAAGLGAAIVWGGVSRLVYDCNRPPEALSAMPATSELYIIPGNQSLSAKERAQRVKAVYTPFCDTVSQQIEAHRSSLDLMVTVHSFNPVYMGQARDVEIGVLHGKDPRFAMAMMETHTPNRPFRVRMNEPYSASDGVAHSLDLHGHRNGLLNVMLEVRNDLIGTATEQKEMADFLIPWIETTLAQTGGRLE